MYIHVCTCSEYIMYAIVHVILLGSYISWIMLMTAVLKPCSLESIEMSKECMLCEYWHELQCAMRLLTYVDFTLAIRNTEGFFVA